MTRPEGFVVVLQTDHAEMCAQLARAWGNERFGAVVPAGVAELAASQHELGWSSWQEAPTMDSATGLPHTAVTLEDETHLPMQLDGPRRLAVREPYAGLLASLTHASMYRRPSAPALLRARSRRVRSFLDASTALQGQMRAGVAASDAEIERNWRLVRAWDGLSHDLLLDRAPRTRRAVPAAAGAALDVRLERLGDSFRVDPWPFGKPRVTVTARGRLLERRFSDQEEMRATLRVAPPVVLGYELVDI